MRLSSTALAKLAHCFVLAATIQFAHAGCSRPIVVPAAPAGKFMMTNEQTLEVSGVYPDLLRSSGKKIGCDFHFVVVPRVRLNMMFEKGTGQLIIPSTQTPERDLLGEFVLLFYGTPVIISARPDLKIRTIADIKNYPKLRVNVVRGYNWGASYQVAVKQLSDSGMVEDVVDASTVIKKMQVGHADITIMTAEIFYGNLSNLGLLETFAKNIRYIKTPDFQPTFTGVYLSYSLSSADRGQLKSMLQNWLSSKALWSALQAALPDDALMSLTPIEKQHRP
jgi:polar amino acid transport system substrate-binding protein